VPKQRQLPRLKLAKQKILIMTHYTSYGRQAAGIVYHVLPVTDQNAFIRTHLNSETIIIAAVRNIGETTPLLIDAASLAVLPEKAVIIDLCTGEGGCVLGSKEDKVVIVDRGVSIINVSGYPKNEPKAASEAFAKCIVNLLLEVMTPNGEINLQNPLLHQSMKKNSLTIA
jgi:NAD/NADP transhydrogenase alpha subunit